MVFGLGDFDRRRAWREEADEVGGVGGLEELRLRAANECEGAPGRGETSGTGAIPVNFSQKFGSKQSAQPGIALGVDGLRAEHRAM